MERAGLERGWGALTEALVEDAVTARERFLAACRNAEAGSTAEALRESSEPSGEYDGILGAGSTAAHLNSRFAPDYHFSAHQFNSMGRCPFQYFAGYVLGLSPLEEVTEEADPKERGLAAHTILARFFRETKRRDGLGTAQVTKANLEQAKGLLKQVTGQYFRERRQLGQVGDARLWEIERDILWRHLERFLEFEVEMQEKDARRGTSYVPDRFEYVFGKAQEAPLALSGPGGTLLLEGRVDRIDVPAQPTSPPSFRVWDYKTGGSSQPRDILRGTDFQLPVYVLAARQNLFGDASECERCGFYVVQRPVNQDSKVLAVPRSRGIGVNEVIEKTLEWLPKLAGQIRKGEFPVAPKDFRFCGTCDYRSICRVNRFRAARTLQPGPAAEEGTGEATDASE
jgi:ATP-dependent helicase/nuclease subunit B